MRLRRVPFVAGVCLLLTLLAVGAVWYVSLRQTPKNTLSLIAEAIYKRDLATFERYVDLEKFAPSLQDYLYESARIRTIPDLAFEKASIEYRPLKAAANLLYLFTDRAAGSLASSLRKGVSFESAETALLAVFPTDSSKIGYEAAGKTARVHVSSGCPPMLDVLRLRGTGIHKWRDLLLERDADKLPTDDLLLILEVGNELWNAFIHSKFPSLSVTEASEQLKTLGKTEIESLQNEFRQGIRESEKNIESALKRPAASMILLLVSVDGIWRVVGIDPSDCLKAEREEYLEKMDETANRHLERVRSDQLMRSYYWEKLTNFVARYPSRTSAVSIRNDMEKIRNTWLSVKAPIHIDKVWLTKPRYGQERIHTSVRNVSDRTVVEYQLVFRFLTGDQKTYMRPSYGSAYQGGRAEERLAPGQVIGDQNRYWEVDFRFREPRGVRAIPIRVKFADGTEWRHPMEREPLVMDSGLWDRASGK